MTWFLVSRYQKTKIDITLPGGAAIQMQGSKTQKGLLENIDSLFQNEAVAEITTNYLSKVYKIYKVTDGRFINALTNLCRENDKDTKSFSECLSNNDVLKSLRRKASNREPPFQYESIHVDIGFPPVQPPHGSVFACNTSRFRGKKIEISSSEPSFDSRIERKVIPKYNCTKKPFPDIQLSKADGKTLFGPSLNKYEKGFVTILD